MLEGLNTINWESLTHGYGEATDVPELIRSLLSENADVRLEAFASLHENIWHQGTVFPATAAAIPFLFELLTHPDVQDKGGIVSLLGCIATGNGALDGAIANDGEEMWRSVLKKQGKPLEDALAQESEVMIAVHRAVAAGLQHLLPYLSDPGNGSLIAEALGNFPEHASWLLPTIDATLASESTEHLRHALADSKARLINNCSGSAARSTEPGSGGGFVG